MRYISWVQDKLNDVVQILCFKHDSYRYGLHNLSKLLHTLTFGCLGPAFNITHLNS